MGHLDYSELPEPTSENPDVGHPRFMVVRNAGLSIALRLGRDDMSGAVVCIVDTLLRSVGDGGQLQQQGVIALGWAAKTIG